LLAGSDLERFTTRIEAPVSSGYRGVTVFNAGRGRKDRSSMQQLGLLEGFDLAAMATTPPTTFIQLSKPPSFRSPIARHITATRNLSTCRSMRY